MGMSVIPIPGDGDFNTRDKYDIKFSWDLSAAPVGTRGVSSYGEGNGYLENGFCDWTGEELSAV